MPKTEIDYSNTIFYKISCKYEDNNELYVGHTTNFVQRKSAHKNSCNNPKSSNYPVKLYKTIRECGGWNNWNMEIIAFRNCADSREARKTEQEYYEKLGATLNSIQPLPPAKIQTVTKPRNIQNNNNINVISGGGFKFVCSKCDYYINKKSSYSKHLTTRKHQDETNNNVATDIFECNICNKVYKSRVGLWKHKKECKETTDTTSIPDNTPTVIDNPTIVIELLKQNQEFKDLILEERREFQKIITDQNEKMMEICKTLIIK